MEIAFKTEMRLGGKEGLFTLVAQRHENKQVAVKLRRIYGQNSSILVSLVTNNSLHSLT